MSEIRRNDVITLLRSYDLSIAQLSRLTRLSRPTIYKHIDSFCEGDFKNVDDNLLALIKRLVEERPKKPKEIDIILRSIFGDSYKELLRMSESNYRSIYTNQGRYNNENYFSTTPITPSFESMPYARIRRLDEPPIDTIIDVFDVLDTYKNLCDFATNYTKRKLNDAPGVRYSNQTKSFIVDYDRYERDFNFYRRDNNVLYVLEYIRSLLDMKMIRENSIEYISKIHETIDMAIDAIIRFEKATVSEKNKPGSEVDQDKVINVINELNSERRNLISDQFSWYVMVAVGTGANNLVSAAINPMRTPPDFLLKTYRKIFNDTHNGDIMLKGSLFGPFVNEDEANKICDYLTTDWRMRDDSPDGSYEECAMRWLSELAKKKGLSFYGEVE